MMMEWLLSNSDRISWAMKMSQPNGFDLLTELKDHLSKNKLRITPITFTSGFLLVLHEACRAGHIELVQYIMYNHQEEFDVNQLILYHPNFDYDISLKTIRWLCNHRKETLIHAAVCSGSIPLLQVLITHTCSVNTPDCCSITPLIKAVAICDIEVIKFLLKNGANVNYQDSDGRTALMHICSAHLLPDIIEPILKVLFDAGANPDLTDKRGFTVLHEVVYNKNSATLKLLVKTFTVSPAICSMKSPRPHPLFLATQLSDLYMTAPTPPLPTQVISDHPSVLIATKIDELLLNATRSMYRYCSEFNKDPEQDLLDCVSQLKQGLKLHASMTSPSKMPSKVHEAYGNMKEVASPEEFRKKYTEANCNMVYLAYQCLIIRERILGYADSTLIEFLLTFGKVFTESQSSLKHIQLERGLKLWLRATDMLIFRLEENVYSNLKELQKLTESGMEKCKVFLQTNKKTQNGVCICEALSNILRALIRNLIQSQYLTIQQFKARHYHDIISPASYRYLVNILQVLHQSNMKGLEAPALVFETVTKCPTFNYGFELSTNLIDVLLDEPEVHVSFLTFLLQCGGDKLVNQIGLFGLRPLYKAKTKEVAKALLKYGAHPDAVNEDGARGSQSFLKKYFKSPSPLQCLAAQAVVKESIPYRDSKSLPAHMKDLISYHDPDHTQLKIKEAFRKLY